MRWSKSRRAAVIAVTVLLVLASFGLSTGATLISASDLPGELVLVKYDDIYLRGFILDDTMMVPVRPIAEAFGATVHWDQKGRTVVNGYVVDIVVRWDIAWMPAKDLAPILGCWFTWDQDTRTVSISNGFRTVYVQAPEGVPYPTGMNYETLEAPTGASNTESLDNLALLPEEQPDLRLPVERREPAGKVALTFDDGPDPELTGKIVDVLDEFGVKGTFFFVGWRAISYSDAAKKVVESGHDVGNHSYSHARLTDLDSHTARQEISKAQTAIKRATGILPKWFRPPYGSYNEEIRTIAREEGASLVTWNLTPDDWQNPGEAVIRERVTSSARDGSIVLLHVREQTLRALPDLIKELLDMGYELVGLSELL